MSSELDILWDPIQIGSVTVPNRVVFAAHNPGFRGDQYGSYLAERARDGAGLCVTGEIPIHQTVDAGFTFAGYDPASIPEIRSIVEPVHREDRPIFIQLGHVGAQDTGGRTLESWGQLWAASGIPSPAFGVIPKEMEIDDIQEIVDGFAVSAECAREGGADGVEIHAGHGYLLTSFLSPLTNQRTDQYGGGTENRARIVLEIGRAMRARVGDDFVIGLKLNFSEFVGDGGITPELAEDTIRLAHAEGIFDYFGITGGNYNVPGVVIAPYSSGLSGHFTEHAAIAKRAVAGDVPVMVTGRVRTISQAARIVSDGQADLVGMIRAQIADPEVVRKARMGRAAEIRRCVGANQGCVKRGWAFGAMVCTVNPAIGRESEWGVTVSGRADVARKVLVVGGGPGGMKLAETAVLRGHDVTLMERGHSLGGALRYAGSLPYRDSWQEVADDLAASLERLEVDVRLDTLVEAADVRAFDPEITFVATGATWDSSGFSVKRPGVAGIGRENGSRVVTPVEALEAGASLGDRIVVVDDMGVYAPLGLAEHFARLGKDVTLVTSEHMVGKSIDEDATRELESVYRRLATSGVSIVAETYVDTVGPTSVSVSHVWTGATREISADAVVLCMLRQSDDDLYHDLKADGLEVRRIGDCLAPREVDDAVFEAVRDAHAI